MFSAKTWPRPEATTDFGEMSPLMVRTSDIVRSGVGGPAGATIGPSAAAAMVSSVAAVSAAEVDALASPLGSEVAEALAWPSPPYVLVTARTSVTTRIRASPAANSRRLLVRAVI